MSTSLVAPSGAAPQAPAPGARSGPHTWPLSSTPGRLRLLRNLIVALALLAGAAGTVAATQAATGTDRVATESGPLLGNAEEIYTSIADADAAAAQAFLSGGLEPTELALRYQADVQRAGEQLAQAAARAGTTGPAADAVRRLNVLLPQYTGLVQAARANNRQGNLIGVAYLLTASELVHGTAGDPAAGVPAKDGLLPAARDLFTAERQRLTADYGAARAGAGWLLTALLTGTLLALLLHTQRFLTRRTRRTVNVGLAAGTLLVLAVGVLCGVLLAQRHAALTASERDGSDRMAAAAAARIAALTQRGAESLALASREGRGPNEQRFAAQTPLLFGESGDGGDGLLVGDERRLAQAYADTHDQVRRLDDALDHRGAVQTALGQGGAAFTALDQALRARAAAAQDGFTALVEGADRGRWLLLVAIPAAALGVCALALGGIHPRLEEYR